MDRRAYRLRSPSFYVIGHGQVVFTTRGSYGRVASVGNEVRESYRSEHAGTMQPSAIWQN